MGGFSLGMPGPGGSAWRYRSAIPLGLSASQACLCRYRFSHSLSFLLSLNLGEFLSGDAACDFWSEWEIPPGKTCSIPATCLSPVRAGYRGGVSATTCHHLASPPAPGGAWKVRLEVLGCDACSGGMGLQSVLPVQACWNAGRKASPGSSRRWAGG